LETTSGAWARVDCGAESRAIVKALGVRHLYSFYMALSYWRDRSAASDQPRRRRIRDLAALHFVGALLTRDPVLAMEQVEGALRVVTAFGRACRGRYSSQLCWASTFWKNRAIGLAGIAGLGFRSERINRLARR
jgi:hypothetical protein